MQSGLEQPSLRNTSWTEIAQLDISFEDKGVGIVLNLASPLIERHDGELMVESEAGARTCSRYRDPIAARAEDTCLTMMRHQATIRVPLQPETFIAAPAIKKPPWSYRFHEEELWS